MATKLLEDPRRILLAVWGGACLWLLLEVLRQGVHFSSCRGHSPGAARCHRDDEGQWSIGLYLGPSPFALKPIEEATARVDAPSAAAWPVANPVFTCAHVPEPRSSFVADPFLWPAKRRPGSANSSSSSSAGSEDSTTYLFFESKTVDSGQGEIGLAQSSDGGATFSFAGIVLDEPWHLSYPFVFEHDNEMFMLPEGSGSGTLRLYRATSFPTNWTLDTVLIGRPMVDASLVRWQERWYMFASDRSRRSSKGCRELEVWWADDLRGPWHPHAANPVKEGVNGARNGGRPIVVDGELYRFGQDCSTTYGKGLFAYKVTQLSPTEFAEEQVDLNFRQPTKGRGEWNGERHHHLDAHQLPDGTWVAAMDGDRYPSGYLTSRMLRRVWLLLLALLVLLVAPLLMYWLHRKQTGAPLVPVWVRRFIPRCCGPVGGDKKGSAASGCAAGQQDGVYGAGGERWHSKALPASARHSRHCSSSDLESALMLGSGDALAGAAARKEAAIAAEGKGWLAGQACGACGPSGKGGSSPRYGGLPRCTVSSLVSLLQGYGPRQWLGVAVLCAALVAAVFCVAYLDMRWVVFEAILLYTRGGARAVPVNGTYSKFTAMVMTHDARMMNLEAFTKHYSQCASLGEIVLVWNKGTPPDVERDFPWLTVPMRVRVEERNSMNNRFVPDPLLRHRGVLMIDDDIIMPCADIERGFARWRRNPQRIVSFFARLVEGDPPEYRCTSCDSYTMAKQRYNLVLAGATFMDSETVFPLYMSEMNAAGRQEVDDTTNCDDLLINFMLAHAYNGSQHCDFVRPTIRIDTGKLSSARLSSTAHGNRFGNVRHQCLLDFNKMYGPRVLKDGGYAIDWDGMGPPWCNGPSWLGCVY